MKKFRSDEEALEELLVNGVPASPGSGARKWELEKHVRYLESMLRGVRDTMLRTYLRQLANPPEPIEPIEEVPDFESVSPIRLVPATGAGKFGGAYIKVSFRNAQPLWFEDPVQFPSHLVRREILDRFPNVDNVYFTTLIRNMNKNG